MKYTNKSNLPEPLFLAVCNDPYDPKSDFTVTGLIKPARISALEALHADALEEDACDRLWALVGQVGHLILERAANKNANLFAEKRRAVTRLGKTVSGQVDLWRQSILVDYKFTSIWAVKDGLKPEWEQQCNLNALICREHGIIVREAQIVVIFRDWSVGEARRSPTDYPQTQAQVLNVPLWAPERQGEFLLTRLQEHIDARSGNMPECSPTDRWLRPEKWAIKKKGAARAHRVYESESEAITAFAGFGAAYELEHRPPVQTRCLDYCAVAKWCEQFRTNDPENWAKAQ